MALNSVHLDEHLKRSMGVTNGYTVTGAVATVTGTLSESQLRSLLDVVQATGYKATVAAGVLTLSPR